MGRKFWGGLGLLASILAGAGVAGAADLAVKAPVYKAPPPPVILSDWSGFYIGINGGYGWGDTKFDDAFNNYLFGAAKPKGGVFGGHAGYNWQYGKVVTGVEIDFDGASIKGTDSVSFCGDCDRPVTLSRTMKFDELATARARLGYAILPDLLAYGTAGIAWGHSTLTGTISNGFASASMDANANNFGWAAGGGVEYYLGHGFIVRGEYLHYDFAKTAYSFPVFFSPNAGTTVDVARGGLSYKF
jgi:outer membrane immunogenic protein